LVLATDGAYASLVDEDLVHAVVTNSTPQAACQDLVGRARVRDGSDNLTLVCVSTSVMPVVSVRPDPRRLRLLAVLAAIGLLILVLAVIAVHHRTASGPVGTQGGVPLPGASTTASAETAQATRSVAVTIELANGQVALTYRGTQPLSARIGSASPVRLRPASGDIRAAARADAAIDLRAAGAGRAAVAVSPIPGRIELMITPGKGTRQATYRFTRVPERSASDDMTVNGAELVFTSHGPASGGSFGEGTGPWPPGKVNVRIGGPAGVAVELAWSSPEAQASATPQPDTGEAAETARGTAQPHWRRPGRETGGPVQSTRPAAATSRAIPPPAKAIPGAMVHTQYGPSNPGATGPPNGGAPTSVSSPPAGGSGTH
jgi:hypothetical protein